MVCSVFLDKRVWFSVVLIAAFSLYYFLESYIRQRPACSPTLKLHGTVCHSRFKKYVMSELENEWWSNIEAIQTFNATPICKRLENKKKYIYNWLTDIKKDRLRYPKKPISKKKVWSQIQYDTCYGNITVYIEPLAGLLRHPWALCKKDVVTVDYVLDKNWLLIPSITDPIIKHAPNIWLFDLGASIYDEGPGGASLKWIVDTYSGQGVNFTRILAWEGKQYEPSKVWNPVPENIKPILQYYNIPCDPNPNSADNPLNYIRRLTRPEDYVVIKIDIDNSPVENALVNQIIYNEDLHVLIDELFWEHHILLTPMNKIWTSEGVNQTMAESYLLFEKMRGFGIRAHSWV